MKWIGQHVWDYISRFRNDVYLETGVTLTMDEYTSGTIGITKIQDSGTTFNDNDTSLMTAAAIADKIESYGYSTTTGDITGITVETDGDNFSDTSGAVTFGIKGNTPISTALDGSDITISVANITTLGTISTGTWQGTAIASAYLDSDTAHLSGTQTFSGAKTFSAATTTFTSATTDSPLVKIKNTTNDSSAGILEFNKDRGADGQDEDFLGKILFVGKDDGTPSTQSYASITSQIHDATSGQESGRLNLQVANHDGGLETGLKLTGGSVNSEIDVNVGLGTSSVTAVAGTLNMGSTATLNNTGEIQVASQPNITTLAGLSAFGTAGTPITITSDAVTFQSANADDPVLILENTTDDNQGARLKFNKTRGADGQDNDIVGEIEFHGMDDGTPSTQQYAKILAQIHDATSGEESGRLKFGVASHDGSNDFGLILTGGSTSNEVDVTVGLGTSSLTDIAGNLTLSGNYILGNAAGLDGNRIKVLPHHFMQNEDGGVNKSILYDDDASPAIGVKASSADGELVAFVEIPPGKTATHVTVYGNDTNNVVEVFEADINASGLTDKTPGAGCVVGTQCDITNVTADTTNYLVIKVTVTATNDVVYGALVEISDAV